MNYCNKCGIQIDVNDNFCPGCGVQLKEAQVPTNKTVKKRKRFSLFWNILLALVAMVILLVLYNFSGF